VWKRSRKRSRSWALSKQLEEQLPNIKSWLVALAGGAPRNSINKSGNSFSFEVQLDVVTLWAEDGGMRALSSLKTKDRSIIPNRSNVNPRLFVASCAKPLHLTFGLGSENINNANSRAPNARSTARLVRIDCDFAAKIILIFFRLKPLYRAARPALRHRRVTTRQRICAPLTH